VEPDQKDLFAEKFKGRYYATPKKMGAQTAEANNNAGMAAAEQIVAFFENGDISCKVN
jgi:D-3-phosphoglycerate dehydrogenase